MSNVLLVWELGSGMGHLARLRPIAIGLVERGHRVIGAFRDLHRVPIVFNETAIEYLQSPAKRTGSGPFQPPATYAEMLANIGFGDATELCGLVGAWQTLFDLIRPDLLICDHSPTAVLASREYSFRRVVLGTGFFCPPAGERLPALRPGMSASEIAASEAAVLGHVNAALDHLQQPRLPRFSDLYSDVDETILTTFAELDHFGPRDSATYWGAWPAGVGQRGDIDWPVGDGARVYAYLKSFPALDEFLERLKTLRLPTVIVGDGIRAETRDRFASRTMQFMNRPIDAAQAAQWCDVALLNATHGMLSSMLMAGKPTLNIPVQFEQRLLSLKVVELRAGVAASAKQAEELVRALDYSLGNRERLAVAAHAFAVKYADCDPDIRINRLLDHIETLLT